MWSPAKEHDFVRKEIRGSAPSQLSIIPRRYGSIGASTWQSSSSSLHPQVPQPTPPPHPFASVLPLGANNLRRHTSADVRNVQGWQETSSPFSSSHSSSTRESSPKRDKISIFTSEWRQPLWWRALSKLQVDDFAAWAEIKHTWLSRKPLHGQYIVTDHDLNPIEISEEGFEDENYATNEASHLLSIFDKFEETLTRTGPDSELMLSSINRIRELLKVMRETLFFHPGVKTGGFVWTVFCMGLQKLVLTDITIMPLGTQLGFERHLFARLAKVATLIARYNVLDSVYQNWSGMTLEKEYESTLVELCSHVLKFLYICFTSSSDRNSTSEESFEEVDRYYTRIADADAKSRAFTVTIEEAAQKNHLKRTAGEISDYDDSSPTETDATPPEKTPTSKRIKI